MRERYDIAIVGAGAAGLTGAEFAARIGAKVALLENSRIGGDCTWTGCVPSKALIRAARIAQDARRAAAFGIELDAPRPNMARVRDWVASTVENVYDRGTPDILRQKGMDVWIGPTTFTDPHTLVTGDRRIVAKHIVICTGARARIPAVAGLESVPYITYDRLFDVDRLPAQLLVLGGGPLGVEQAQAFRRLGAEVTLIGPTLLPREEPETQTFVASLLEREGVRLIRSRATAARTHDKAIELSTAQGVERGDLLLVSTGRVPNVQSLALEHAGVRYSDRGIAVDRYLRTNVAHIYACGDVIGGPQFSHLAGWQCFRAVRNALLPGRAAALPRNLPAVTFTDPEVARVGLLEREAHDRHGSSVRMHTWPLTNSDRAVCDGDVEGYIKLITSNDRSILGATVVAARAGEMIDEISVAMARGLTIDDLAGAIHAYPTWTIALQQFAAAILMQRFGSSRAARMLRLLTRLTG
ncbi:MAG: dihydrolipoyl dehydrogenase family protein [Gemmatimonadaceae bacterium]